MLDPRPHAPLPTRSLILAIWACVGIIILLLALSCSAEAQLTPVFSQNGGRGQRIGRATAPEPTWPVLVNLEPCFTTYNVKAACDERPMPPTYATREQVEAIRDMVKGYLRAQVTRGRLVLTKPGYYDAWTNPAWSDIQPTLAFAPCWFYKDAVPNVLGGGGSGMTCTPFWADTSNNRAVVSAAGPDDPLLYAARGMAEAVASAAPLNDARCASLTGYPGPDDPCPIYRSPILDEAAAYAVEAFR